MELSRRDALAALAALGGGTAAAAGAYEWGRSGTPDGVAGDEAVRETFVAVAGTVYPSELSGIREFVESFLPGRLDRPDHAAGIREAVAELNRLAESWHGAPVAELDPETRDAFLREVGADVADEDPEGTTAERVRYYVVNELLLALYSSPTGGELVGIENPQGHPGGSESYARGPGT